MADQCIVCLEDLDQAPNLDEVDPRSVIAENGHLDGIKSPNPQPSTSDEQQLIAVIETCQHVLHDACLKEWTQKANSCPICRTQFNKVGVRETTTGPPLYTYEVEDKKQVAEFDPLAWIQEQDHEEVIDRPCPICGTQEDEDQLLLCDGCDAPYHTYCVDLDRVPVGNWFCMECSHEEGDRRNAAENLPAVPVRRERTLAQQRQNRSRRRVRANAWEGAWNQIATRVHDATGLDLDYDGQEELNDYRQAHFAQLRTEAQEREWREWQQRVAIASRQGAGRVFINATRPVVQPHVSPEPPQESDTERRAWATYERVRREGTPGASSSRKRKATESPREPQPQEPERKLKRPRTRRVREREQPGSASEAPAEALAPNGRASPRVSATPRRSPPRDAPATGEQPSFLASLLKEVEQSAKADSHGDSDVPRTNAASPVPEFASPILSPIASGYSSPRPLSLTPPPRRSGSPVQTPISSYVQPIYPPVNPADFSPNRSRRERAGSRPSTPPLTMQTTSHIRHPQPQRPQIALSEYQMSLPPSSTMKHMNELELIRHKGEIKDWVKKAIDIHHRNHLTDDQYTDVNRRVSRKLYNIIPDVAVLSEEDKHRWQNRTSGEVDKAVEFLGYGRNHGLGAASGSNGVTA